MMGATPRRRLSTSPVRKTWSTSHERKFTKEANMADQSNSFSWYELLTTDTAGAKAFYADVLGWTVRDAAAAEFPYSLFTIEDCATAGLMELPEEGRRQGATPRWVGYGAGE